jgi:hypothetical protein
VHKDLIAELPPRRTAEDANLAMKFSYKKRLKSLKIDCLMTHAQHKKTADAKADGPQ